MAISATTAVSKYFLLTVLGKTKTLLCHSVCLFDRLIESMSGRLSVSSLSARGSVCRSRHRQAVCLLVKRGPVVCDQLRVRVSVHLSVGAVVCGCREETRQKPSVNDCLTSHFYSFLPGCLPVSSVRWFSPETLTVTSSLPWIVHSSRFSNFRRTAELKQDFNWKKALSQSSTVRGSAQYRSSLLNENNYSPKKKYGEMIFGQCIAILTCDICSYCLSLEDPFFPNRSFCRTKTP